jgi:hypothetical protein
MADKAAPNAMGGLSTREQEILVAALSKCLKNGDIQVSPSDLAVSTHLFLEIPLKFSFILQSFPSLCVQGSGLLAERLYSLAISHLRR